MIVFTAAWRLFFPAAGLFAGLALPLWLLMYGGNLQAMADPVSWHMHEMLFGYLPAALAGFLLTAMPNWTGRPALAGAPLAGLFTLWLVGRGAMFFAPESIASSLITLAFLGVLGALAARDILKSNNTRNLPVVALIFALALAQALLLFNDTERGITGGFAMAFVLMVFIGGRVTPAFSRNWLMKRGAGALPAPFGSLDRVAIGLSVVTALAWVGLGEHAVTGISAGASALALTLRLARWQGFSVRSEPLLLAQHAAYLWLAIAMVLLALSTLTDWATVSQVRHAMGAGAVASMTLIVMLRAALGHSGRAIIGTPLDWLMLSAVHIGAGLRVVADWTSDPTLILNIAGWTWAVAFVLFTLRVLPIALTPRQ